MTPLILALIQQESSGTQLDVMQSSESQGYG
ncbi:lysozyme family protein, partial [Bacillus sp. B-TM1]